MKTPMLSRLSLTLPVVLLVLLLATAVRLHLLGVQSLWNDEGTAFVQATRTLPEIAANAARDIHPPGYYALLAFWRTLTGDSEFALRALSAFAGVLTVALTFALGRRLYHPLAGWTAAALVALNTFNLYYSQEARMYALLGMWAVAGMWAFVGMIRTRERRTARRWAVLLALVNAAGLYTHYAYPAVMVAQGLLLLLELGSRVVSQRGSMSAGQPVSRSADQRVSTSADQRVSGTDVGARHAVPPVAVPAEHPALNPVSLLLTFIAVNLLTLALYLPWLPTAWAQITTWPTTGQPIPPAEALPVILGWLTMGLTHAVSQTSAAISFFALFGLLVFPAQQGRHAWWRMLVPVLWVVVTVGGFLALDLFREANLKFLIPAQIGFALWVGRGLWVLWTLKPRRTAPLFQASPKLAAGVGMFALLLALWSGLDPLYHDPQFQRDDYRGIVQAITASPRPDDAVILNAPGQSEVFRYYYGDGGSVYPLPVGLTVNTDATLTAVREIIAQHDRIYAVLWGTAERDPQQIVEATLDREAFEIDSRWFGDVRLVRYVTPQPVGEPVESGAQFGDAIVLERYALSLPEGATYAPGEPLQIRLTWRAAAPVPTRYKIFVQLLYPDGTLAAQRDSEPVGGTAPTDGWTVDELISDNHAVMIPDNLAELNYTLIIGFYTPDQAASRLPVLEPDAAADSENRDYLRLATITVAANVAR